MTKLESRSMQNTPWEYQFYVDIEGNVEEPRVATALEGIGRNARYLRVLGCYPRKADPSLQVPKDVDLLRRGGRPAVSTAVPSPRRARSPTRSPRGGRRRPGRTLVKVGDVVFGEGSSSSPARAPSRTRTRSSRRPGSCAKGAAASSGAASSSRARARTPSRGSGSRARHPRARGLEYHLPIVTEVMAPEDVEKVALRADMLQIGARNMQNFSLLKEVGRASGRSS